MDDLYICDNTGTSFNDRLGDIAVDGHLFTGDGADAGHQRFWPWWPLWLVLWG
jgi:hypothetical protein